LQTVHLYGKGFKPLEAQSKKALPANAKTQNFLFLIPPNITYDDFVNPPSNISTIQKNNGQRLFGSLITDIPLGVVSLSAYIKQFLPVDVRAIDFNVTLNQETEFDYASFIEYFKDKIAASDFKPDYVGISALFTPAYHSIIELSQVARELFPDAMILVGGNFPTAMYRDILNDSPYVDAVCYGEGEKGLLGLLQAEDKQAFLSQSVSWATREKISAPNINLTHDFIEDLDEIPMLDYDILDLEGYKLNPTSSRYAVSEKYKAKMSNGDFTDDVVIETQKGKTEQITYSYSMPIMTSRGCPFKCTFCASHAAHGRDMRYHSLERVLEDAKKMIARYGIDGVVIQDDHFMAGKDRPYKIVDGLGKLGLGMFFQNALAIYALDIEFLKLLKHSGVDALVLPIESGSERVLKELMKKPLRLDLIPKAVKNCRDAGIFTDCNVILGMPGETKQDIDDSRAFLKTIYADWFRVFVATPIPGSEMYATCEANDYFKVSPLKANYKRAVVETEHCSPEYVQYMCYLMNIELNFVHNANLRLGNYEVALESFINVINVKPDHAIAHYYAGVCYTHLNQPNKAKNHFVQAYEYTQETDFWNEYIEMFEIGIKAAYEKYQTAVETI
jgi:radical SAM superfamily enzyme YgiQ (UPF0313 family)